MLDILKKIDIKKTGIFAAGVLFGTAGVKVLGSKDAKKVYTNCTAAALRAKDCVMKTATTIQENAEDIYAEAQQINEERAAAEEAEPPQAVRAAAAATAPQTVRNERRVIFFIIFVLQTSGFSAPGSCFRVFPGYGTIVSQSVSRFDHKREKSR